MKKIGFLSLCCILVAGCGHSIYFGKNAITPRTGVLKNEIIELAVLDIRPDKSNAHTLTQSAWYYLRRTYPQARISLLPANKFFNTPTSGRITLKMKILRNEINFLPEPSERNGKKTEWYGPPQTIPAGYTRPQYAITELNLELFDLRAGNSIHKKDFVEYIGIDKSPVRQILDQSFSRALNRTCLFLDDSLIGK